MNNLPVRAEVSTRSEGGAQASAAFRMVENEDTMRDGVCERLEQGVSSIMLLIKFP